MGVKGGSGENQFTLQMLDSALGHSLQSWEFSGRTPIRIGRGSDNDIVVSDQQVSRFHVELLFSQSGWSLRSHGRNGTWIDGSRVDSSHLSDRLIFQLGSSGPMFQFLAAAAAANTSATLDNMDPHEFDFLRIDERQKNDEVQEIVESDSFRRLCEEAERLRSMEDRPTEQGAT